MPMTATIITRGLPKTPAAPPEACNNIATVIVVFRTDPFLCSRPFLRSLEKETAYLPAPRRSGSAGFSVHGAARVGPGQAGVANKKSPRAHRIQRSGWAHSISRVHLG